MIRYLITFSGAAYEATTRETVEQGPKLGADEVYVYDDAWLAEHPFSSLPCNRWVFDHPGDQNGRKRGICWFSWKPLVILDALSKMQDGDICLYLDGDTYPIAPFGMLYDQCAKDGGIMLFAATGCNNREWIKRDCRDVMGATHPVWELPINSQHFTARFMLFQKGHWRTQQFLYEWLTYCLNPYATTFDESCIRPDSALLDRSAGLQEHRTEQAILSVLGHRYGCKPYREADEFGNSVDDDKELFGQIFKQVYATGPRDQAGSIFRRIP